MTLARHSAVLRPPRTPAAQRSLSPSAYAMRLAATTAAQTGLSCSALPLVRVLRPIPRRGATRAPVLARHVLPSPRDDRLGPRIVPLSRLQTSLHVAARVLAPRCTALAASRALDVPLGTRGSLPAPGTCYPALRRLPGRDLPPLEKRSLNGSRPALARGSASVRHDAPSAKVSASRRTTSSPISAG